ncbi:PREDICTED: keratin, type I cytoskeletal 20 [Elephantulus edwardii]|uniref:keratin, type I cytoskeletal 20 n=1 Tax=Elephantulus edwardii TaxID=28737 RepID=UPI0003F0BA57|nr:PREDICTED: keratin, type I cytoskeletal 20 [Elephantulus edwardii]
MDFSRRSVHRAMSISSQVSPRSISGSVYRTGGMQRYGATPSVYGGAGGLGTRISTSRHMMSYGGEFAGAGGDLYVGDGKMVMQSLNDRLANYLEKVQALERSNTTLEMQIKRWYETNVPSASRDYSAYYKQIEELRDQIKNAQMKNAQCILQIDNAKLAAEDFRLKCETERGLRITVEADLQGLSKVFDDLTLSKSDLEMQVEELNKDLVLLKKEHEEEVEALRKQLGTNINVEVDAAPGLNLSNIMNEMRQKYEVLAQKNLQEVKENFDKQTEMLQQQMTVNTEEMKEYDIQVQELKRVYQNLEIDLQSHLSMKESLERTLEDTKARYSNQLAQIQALISSLEIQLMQIRTDTEQQTNEYNILLGIKTRLEQEIATYRRLLEGEDVTTSELWWLGGKELKRSRKIKTVVEEVVDGKVVSSQVREIEENI